ncbi:hypothetical protein SSAG_05971 [Streptomyces sp. Mg1]|nr:hypothetical protein SSAG_05971 [Streptomyces sp. Mg1]
MCVGASVASGSPAAPERSYESPTAAGNEPTRRRSSVRHSNGLASCSIIGSSGSPICGLCSRFASQT